MIYLDNESFDTNQFDGQLNKYGQKKCDDWRQEFNVTKSDGSNAGLDDDVNHKRTNNRPSSKTLDFSALVSYSC
jgi:hypothetical protein